MIISSNKKAKFNYYLIEYYTAGIQLFGTEVKSIRKKNVSISDSFCQMKNGELYSFNMHIAKYKFGNYYNHDPIRIRKLLLHKRELLKIYKKLINPGFSIIPIELFINRNGYIKLNISLAKGKKRYDKREIIKKRDEKRNIINEIR